MDDHASNIWDDVPDWGGVAARRLVRAPDGKKRVLIRLDECRARRRRPE